MEFDEIVVKETPGLCRCCLSEGCYKDLSTEYTWMEEQEIYADMLLECFDISISQHMEGPNGPNRLICEVCITRLRDACNFKKQVLDSEKKFVDMVGRGEFKAKAIEYVGQMKSEDILELQPVEETEIEYLEDDMDYDDGNRDDPEPTVSEDITVTALPIKGKRGRPKKTIVKPEKKKPKAEDKPKTKIAKDAQIESSSDRQRKYKMTKLLTTIIECSTIMPFRWFANKFMCFYCRCAFVDSSKLKQHTAEEHSDVKLKSVFRNNPCTRIKLDISEISCKLCPKPVSTLDEFLDHISHAHDVKINTTLIDSLFSFKLNDEIMKCLDCGQNFRFFSPLLAHVHRFHSKLKKFLCDICGKGFIAKVTLYGHVKSVHSNDGFEWGSDGKRKTNNDNLMPSKLSLKCPKCPEIFRSRYLRKQHLALVHDVEASQFKCEECPRIFTAKSLLVDHKLRIHLKERTIACEICGFKVFSKDLLKRHMVKHDDRRPFQCDFCMKSFQRKRTLVVHRRTHTKERPYVCKECGEAFVQCTSLKLHMRVHDDVGNSQAIDNHKDVPF